MNPEVDDFLERIEQWQAEFKALRAIILDCGLTEEYKWGVPAYTFKSTNVILLGGYKDNCVISFLKGVLLNDADGILSKPGENSQSARIIRFTSVQEIVDLKPTIKAYIFEAIEIEKAGLKVVMKESKDLVFPDELVQKFESDAAFKSAFEALTPGRQRAYNLHFSSSKNAKTREGRIEKYAPRILKGIGINDCTCGFTKRKPTCDGSHKYI